MDPQPVRTGVESPESLRAKTAHIFCVAAIGLLFGLVLMVWTWVRAASMSADGAHYMELAERSRRLGPHAGMDWYAGPGYPVIVGWLSCLVNDLEFAGRLTSFLFALATLAGVGVLGFRLFGSSVAAVAVGLLGVHTTFVRHAVMAETDAAYGCWLVWSILFAWELRRATGFRHLLFAALLGISLGLGYLTRPEAVPLAGLLGIWYLWPQRETVSGDTSSVGTTHSRVHWAHRLGCSFLVVAIFLIIASPYLMKLHEDLGRWSLSGKERSIVLKFVPDKQNYEEVLKLGVTGALLRRPSNILHWLPYHLQWGLPQFAKSLHLAILALAALGLVLRGSVRRSIGAVGLLLWASVPFIFFFFITFPGRRYFMQALPQFTILAAVGILELADCVARWRRNAVVWWNNSPAESASWRAFRIATLTPVLLVAASTLWGNRKPIEESLRTERAIGERILKASGPGRRILGFTVTAFYARGERVPLWGPMEGIVRCHGYGKPRTYDDLVAFVRQNRVEYVVLDHDLRADCPDFLDRVKPEDFELVIDDIVDHHGPHLVYRFVRQPVSAMHAN